ncbi:exopolysaccharide biosynthesis GT4 family glycosyltransferase EpsE [Palleronia sp. KMU-117]|uniref:exopolysaccharide biosynthesis GT4 family glycosyltransferase EpsE n=1 Tax=Palleronia sp. KMU-117 TaxID=3434108 RepID=UPI003D74D888
MKVGYLVPEFPGQTHAFFWREIRALEELGAEIRLISTRKPPADACPHAFREAAVARTTYLFPPEPGAMASAIARSPQGVVRALRYAARLSASGPREVAKNLGLVAVAATLRSLAARAGLDHVHIHSCANSANIGAMARLMGGPSYSLTLHGGLSVYGSDHAMKFAGASFVSAVTRPLAAEIAAVAPALRAPVIMMGVDTDEFRPPEHAAERPVGAPFRIVSIARLNMTKGHRFLLRAMAELAARAPQLAIEYRIVGEGPARDQIAAEIAALGLTATARLDGSKSEDEVRAILGTADALALTSVGQGEAAPVAVMEAMAMGLPVIVSRIGGTPDMIVDRVDGLLVPQEDVGAIAGAIEFLATDPAAAAAMRQAARQAAIARFDYRANAAKLWHEITSDGR